METMYVFGGYILTGGKLQNGNPWQGVNVMLAEVKADGKGGYNAPRLSLVYSRQAVWTVLCLLFSLCSMATSFTLTSPRLIMTANLSSSSFVPANG